MKKPVKPKKIPLTLEGLAAVVENGFKRNAKEIDNLARMMQEGFSEMITRAEFNARFEQVDARFEQVDKHFEQIDAQFEEMKSELWYTRNHIDIIEKEINSIKADLKNVTRTHEVEALELRVAILEKIVKGMMKK